MKKISIKFFAVLLLLTTIAIACKKEPVQGISLDNSLLIKVGETATLTPTFIPTNAHNKKVSWESENPNVATVDNTGKVTGISVGTAAIKVITEDGGKTTTCAVTVIQPIEPEMIWVEGGTFMMGCDDNNDECEDQELPRHEVTLSGFYISKYMVTQKEWKAAMGKGGSSDYSIGDDYPAWYIDWNSVQEYISRLNAHTGKNYRLPTEAEWEYAARGGNQSKGYKYSGSNNIYVVAWFSGNYMASNPLRAVGLLKPNELGIYDMSGNMWELCSDYWSRYTDEPQTNPTGPNTNANGTRVVRSGAFYNSDFQCRVTYRISVNPDHPSYGFRLVHPK
jgi:formylglycine-generating enzyme required for sulfatase activity